VKEAVFKGTEDHHPSFAIVLADIHEFEPVWILEYGKHIQEVDTVLDQVAAALSLIPFEHQLGTSA
jgi:hypothetical protein